jgi:hypothetical protein
MLFSLQSAGSPQIASYRPAAIHRKAIEGNAVAADPAHRAHGDVGHAGAVTYISASAATTACSELIAFEKLSREAAATTPRHAKLPLAGPEGIGDLSIIQPAMTASPLSGILQNLQHASFIWVRRLPKAQAADAPRGTT